MPQNFGLFNLPRRTGEERVPLPNTPLEETNPWLSKIADFGKGFLGLGDGLAGENPSMAEGIGEAAGMFNPEKVMGLGIAGMTRFLKNGVPDVAARKAATEAIIDRIIGAGVDAGARSDDIEKAVEFAQRFPRTIAHQDVVYNPDLAERGFAGLNRLSPDKQRIRVELGPMELMERGDPQAVAYSRFQQGARELAASEGVPMPTMQRQGIFPFASTLAHETQHTGQRLINPAMKGLPNYSQSGPNYLPDPREKAARLGALKRIYGIK